MTAVAVMSRLAGATRLVERNAYAYRKNWLVFATGFFEPVFFLLSIGIGVGELIGNLTVDGRPVSYEAFVAPGLMATVAMNGAVLDTTVNFFVKFKYMRTYDAVLATPMTTGSVAAGEIGWSLLRGGVYATAFLVTMTAMGLVESGWAVLAVPVSLLVGFAFAGAGLAATTWMRSFVDFDYLSLLLVPLFLFSATFFPLSEYPGAVAAVVRLTPLYQGVALERGLVLGDLSWSLLGHAAYLAAMGTIGLTIASRRLGRLLQP
jgi:lipooligosaccharide transport system permease protein